MNIKVSTNHEITFRVVAFWNEEGGMGEASFGKARNELAEAIHDLEMARANDSSTDWIIVADVNTSISHQAKP